MTANSQRGVSTKSRRIIPNLPAQFPGDFWPAGIFAECALRRRDAKARKGRKGDEGNEKGIWEMERSECGDETSHFPLRQPRVNNFFQHVERHGALAEDHVVEIADVEPVAELFLGAGTEFEDS